MKLTDTKQSQERSGAVMTYRTTFDNHDGTDFEMSWDYSTDIFGGSALDKAKAKYEYLGAGGNNCRLIAVGSNNAITVLAQTIITN